VRTPCTSLIAFGITGDLARKKIFSALYELAARGHDLQVIGVGRSAWDDAKLRQTAAEAIRSGTPGADEEVMRQVLGHLTYMQGNYDEDRLYREVASRVEGHEKVLCYLAVPPTVFENVIVGVANSKVRTKSSLLIEKPFGSNTATAARLADLICTHFNEDQLFAVDHYLQKESLQNVSVLRFANRVFEPLWNGSHIESVAVIMAENFGIGDRAGFFDQIGTLRDVVQSHALQIVAAIAMEPPDSALPAAVDLRRTELLSQVRPLDEADITFGQYIGYLDAEGVASDSTTDTYVRARLSIENDRWNGVSWMITAGKALPTTVTEIVVTFKATEAVNFIGADCLPERNYLSIRLAPDESIALALQTRSATVPLGTTPAQMVAEPSYREEPDFGPYARLFLDAMCGDHTQFASIAVVHQSWRIVENVLHRPMQPTPYPQGAWGPPQDRLLCDDTETQANLADERAARRSNTNRA
jgi:glucose-6-phosphate 1-dehydrogenase